MNSGKKIMYTNERKNIQLHNKKNTCEKIMYTNGHQNIQLH